MAAVTRPGLVVLAGLGGGEGQDVRRAVLAAVLAVELGDPPRIDELDRRVPVPHARRRERERDEVAHALLRERPADDVDLERHQGRR